MHRKYLNMSWPMTGKILSHNVYNLAKFAGEVSDLRKTTLLESNVFKDFTSYLFVVMLYVLI